MILLLLSGTLFCQEENLSLRESVEEILALSDDADPAALLEELEELKAFPVNINGGDEKEISRLFFLTEFQVMVLADHVRKNGSVVTLYELALLPAFDRNTVQLMAPYISLKPAKPKGGRSYGRILVTLTASARFSNDESAAEGMRSLMKMKHKQGSFTFGLTAENDPGEPFIFKNAPGADFLSGYVQYEGKGLINRIIAGDFSVRAGEGVLLNSSRWMGSWLSSPSFMSGRSVSSPYTSTEENSFFRGISLTLGGVNSGALLFASSNKIDARLLFTDDSVATGVRNLVRGGIHVTESQLAARNSLTETVTGLRLIAGTGKARGGVTATATWFSLPFVPDVTEPENLHAFAGDRLLNLSADIRAGTGSILFFLLARHFAPGYHAFHSGAFRAGSGSGNETGLSASVHLEAARHLFITAAADHYRIPWPRYRSSSPSYGSRIEIKGDYVPRENISLRLSWTSSAREYDAAAETGTAVPVTRTRQQLGLVFDMSIASTLRLTTRASASFIHPSQERGYLLGQDFSWSFRRVPLKLWFRYALCSTGGWDSRLYAWENDLLSSFSIPALYGEMARSFLMLSWKPAEFIEARVKYGYTDGRNNSSGGMKQELKGQIKIEF